MEHPMAGVATTPLGSTISLRNPARSKSLYEAYQSKTFLRKYLLQENASSLSQQGWE